jgi:hypothetical protein
MKLTHFCERCGASSSQRKYWKYIIDNDESLNHVSVYKKNMLINYILFCIEKNLTNRQNEISQSHL